MSIPHLALLQKKLESHFFSPLWMKLETKILQDGRTELPSSGGVCYALPKERVISMYVRVV